jgi:UDP-N-acetyl-D-galactosamine dehydrogenase
MELKDIKIAVIGLGYVGLPLAVEFGKKFEVSAFDINKYRIDQLSQGIDHTLELTKDQIQGSGGLQFTCSPDDLYSANFYIITVPTPVDHHNRPDLTPLIKASETVGKCLQKGDIVVYESTVYPGCTEQDCVPVLERVSGLTFNTDFYCGYSPERINPGDKEHTVTKILKVTSGSTPEVAEIVDNVYKSIIVAGTHKATSIKVAEASKVIENSQRDINIAFVNELSKIFNRIGIDTNDVLDAAGTKWNFLKFKPGLVGGHCIGVDPYYLAQKALEVGYHPEIILAGRRVNDGMGAYVATEVVKLMLNKNIGVKNSSILILGFTFKENCPDVRNTRVIDILKELHTYGVNVTIYDPWASPAAVMHEYGVKTFDRYDEVSSFKYDAIIMAVSHHQFSDIKFSDLRKNNAVVYDIKSFIPVEQIDARL